MNAPRTRKSGTARAVLLAATALAAVAATRVQVRNDLRSWFVQGDPAAARYEAFRQEFGSDEVLMVALDCRGPVFRTPVLRTVERLSGLLQEHPQVRGVISLSTVHALHAGDGTFAVSELGRLLPFAQTPPAAIQARLAEEPVSYHGLVGPDEEVTVLYVRMRDFENEALRGATLDEVRRTLEGCLEGTALEYHLAGTGLLFEAVNELSGADLAVTFAAALGLCALLLRMALSGWDRTGLALAGALLAATWSLGLLGLIGTPLNLVTAMAPTLVAIVALANAVHLLGNRTGSLPGHAGRRGRAQVLRACLFSALTSGVAFLALLTCDVQVLRELGLACGMGVFLGLAAPWLLTRAFPRAARPPRLAGGSRLPHALEEFGDRLLRRRRLALGVLAVVVGVAAPGLARLHIDTDSLGLLDEEHPVRADHRWIERRFGFYAPLEFELRAAPGAFFRPEAIAAVERFQQALDGHPLVQGVHALPDLFACLDRAGGEAPPAEAIPAVLAAYRDGLDADDLDRFLAPDGSRTLVSGRTHMQHARGIEAVIQQAEGMAADLLGPDIRVQAVGYLPLYVRICEYLGRAFLQSLPLVIGLNLLVLLVLLRDLRWALLGSLPNALPILLMLAAMGWAGLPLDVAPVAIACVAFGVLVDDTIHLLVHGLHARAEGRPGPEAARTALRRAGASVTWTTVILSAGFLTFLTARLPPVRTFGLLLTGTLVMGLVCDLVLVPLLLAGARRAPSSARTPRVAGPPRARLPGPRSAVTRRALP